MSAYLNGTFLGSFETSRTLAQLTPGGNWLGRSKFSGDSVADATYKDFRVYKGLLTPQEVSANFAAGSDATLTSDIPAVVVGDINGDGRDDVFFGSEGGNLIVSASSASARGALPVLLGLPEEANVSATLVMGGQLVKPFALGDLNADGFDDYALATSRELKIYLGSSSITVPYLPLAPRITIVGADLTATGGDFDGDGLGDLSVTGRPVEDTLRSFASQTHVYSNLLAYPSGTTLRLSDSNFKIATSGLDRSVSGLRFNSAASINEVATLPTSAINGAGDLTTSLWFRTTDAGFQGLVQGLKINEVNSAFDNVPFEATLVGSNQLRLTINPNRLPGAFQTFTIPRFNDGEYHHLAITRAAAVSQVRIFLDGVAVATWQAPAAVFLPIDAEAVYVGNSSLTVVPSLFGERFKGDLSDLSFFNRALSDAEVRSISQGNLTETMVGLRARYKLDEASGTALVDATGQNPDGQLGISSISNSTPNRGTFFTAEHSQSSQPFLDLNNDQVSDLAIAAAFSNVGANASGRISVVSGARAPRTLPATFDVLENWSITGNSFVRDTGTGQPTRFDFGGSPFTFAAGSTERWFQFTTVGDGTAANTIRLNGPVRMDLLDAAGGLLQRDQTAISMRVLPAGTYYLRVFLPTSTTGVANSQAIALGNLFDDANTVRIENAIITDTYKAAADATDLGVDKVQLGGASTFSLDAANQIPFNFSNLGWQSLSNERPANDSHTIFAGDRSIRTTRETTAVSATARVEDGIGIHANGLLTFDLNEIRTAAGYGLNQAFRFIVDKAGLNDFANVGTIRNMVFVSSVNSILSGYVNGQSVAMTNTGGTWSFTGAIPAAQTYSSPFHPMTSTYQVTRAICLLVSQVPVTITLKITGYSPEFAWCLSPSRSI